MLSRGVLLQRTTRLISKTSSSKFNSSARLWLENLFSSNVPKGFGKYYPKGGGGTSGGTSSGAGKSAGKIHILPAKSSAKRPYHITLTSFDVHCFMQERKQAKPTRTVTREMTGAGARVMEVMGRRFRRCWLSLRVCMSFICQLPSKRCSRDEK